ncbi:MAG: glycosyltransferase [Gemmatimonadaceae bacterium]
MRILFDARSVRTPAGHYVMAGLVSAWLRAGRGVEVAVAITRSFDRARLPAGAEPVALRQTGWIEHVRREIPTIANSRQADIIFSPNGFPPADPRAVIYFQDIYHFRILTGRNLSARDRAGNVVRALWRSHAAPRCLAAIPVSEHIADDVRRRVPIPVRTIPNGVDVGGVRWTGDADRVFVMGGIGARKGEATAIRAWAEVVRSDPSGSTVMEIGGAEPTERRAQLGSLAEALGVGGRVTFAAAASRDAFLEQIARCRVALSCSTLEAFGLPVAEALAMGAPVVCSDIPAHAELVSRAGAGSTFPAGDVSALARALHAALDGAPPPRRTTPPAGWTWDARANEHLDWYEELSGAAVPVVASDVRH